jgi:hypothetical protein
MKAVSGALSDERRKELARLDGTIAVLDEVRSGSQSTRARRDELELDWQLFARRMRLLTPQSYGTRFQKYFERFYGWTSIPQVLDCGDAATSKGSVEIKVSLITPSNDHTNFVQIRPHQGVGYRFFVVDETYKVWRFDLTARQMKKELELLGETAHGVKAQGSASKEYAIRFDWKDTDPARRRWLRSYLVTDKDVTPDQMLHGTYEDAATVRIRLEASISPSNR